MSSGEHNPWDAPRSEADSPSETPTSRSASWNEEQVTVRAFILARFLLLRGGFDVYLGDRRLLRDMSHGKEGIARTEFVVGRTTHQVEAHWSCYQFVPRDHHLDG